MRDARSFPNNIKYNTNENIENATGVNAYFEVLRLRLSKVFDVTEAIHAQMLEEYVNVRGWYLFCDSLMGYVCMLDRFYLQQCILVKIQY